MNTTHALAGEIEDRLRAVSRPERAEGKCRYLKSDLEHLGVSVPTIRKVASAVHRERPNMPYDELVTLIEALWARPVHERRMVAVELLSLTNATLSANDAPLLERLLRESRTWALVDPLSVSVVGVLAEREPEGWDPIVRGWARDPDRWLQRASLLSHLPALRQGAGDFERFGELSDALLDEREFFVRKAIGWVLRETGKQRPDLVTAWLLPRAARRRAHHPRGREVSPRTRARTDPCGPLPSHRDETTGAVIPRLTRPTGRLAVLSTPHPAPHSPPTVGLLSGADAGRIRPGW